MKRRNQVMEPDFVVIPNKPLSALEREKLSAVIAESKKNKAKTFLVPQKIQHKKNAPPKQGIL